MWGGGRVFASIIAKTLVDNSYAAFVLTIDNKYRWSINGTLHAITLPFVEKKVNSTFKSKFIT